MSRVMLAVKNALADQDRIPLMVFDEIDANVGGEIARAVGKKMAQLGEKHQVVAITHMPQVASVSHNHYFVCKEVRNDKTRSILRKVEGEERIAEIERMLALGVDGIVSGEVRVSSRSPHAEEVFLNILENGECFGEIAM